LAVAYPFTNQSVFQAVEAELMQRLLEIQGGGSQRSPELIAEDERLMDGLQKRTLAGMRSPTVPLSQDSPGRTRFTA
jgi:hypothetical protein